VVAVANHNPDYATFSQVIPALAIHAVCDIIGVILIGAALRRGKTPAVNN
jgi:hypothetical protein